MLFWGCDKLYIFIVWPFLPFPPFVISYFSGMKFVFEIKTEPVTQAAIIIAIITVPSRSLAMIVIYSLSPPVCIFCRHRRLLGVASGSLLVVALDDGSICGCTSTWGGGGLPPRRCSFSPSSPPPSPGSSDPVEFFYNPFADNTSLGILRPLEYFSSNTTTPLSSTTALTLPHSNSSSRASCCATCRCSCFHPLSGSHYSPSHLRHCVPCRIGYGSGSPLILP